MKLVYAETPATMGQDHSVDDSFLPEGVTHIISEYDPAQPITSEKNQKFVADIKDADIIISAAGCPGLVTADYVSPGQIVIDVGVTLDKVGKLHGDAAFEEVEPIVHAITPVPGGVGPMTITMLLRNTLVAAKG